MIILSKQPSRQRNISLLSLVSKIFVIRQQNNKRKTGQSMNSWNCKFQKTKLIMKDIVIKCLWQNKFNLIQQHLQRDIIIIGIINCFYYLQRSAFFNVPYNFNVHSEHFNPYLLTRLFVVIICSLYSARWNILQFSLYWWLFKIVSALYITFKRIHTLASFPELSYGKFFFLTGQRDQILIVQK